MIQRRGKDHPEIVPQSIDFISDESLRMKNLVEELLILARTDQASHLQPRQIELIPTLKKLVGSLQPLIKQRITVSGPDQALAWVDPASFDEIMTNLLTNAGKYSPAEQTIEIAVTSDDQQATVAVKDHGTGILPQDREHLFDCFYRSDEVRGTIPGTRLGLAIVQKLAQLNYATIEVSDNQPQGAIFTVTLPCNSDKILE